MEIELEEIRQKYIQTLIEMRQNFRSNEKSQTFKITSNHKTNNHTKQPMPLSVTRISVWKEKYEMDE